MQTVHLYYTWNMFIPCVPHMYYKCMNCLCNTPKQHTCITHVSQMKYAYDIFAWKTQIVTKCVKGRDIPSQVSLHYNVHTYGKTTNHTLSQIMSFTSSQFHNQLDRQVESMAVYRKRSSVKYDHIIQKKYSVINCDPYLRTHSVTQAGSTLAKKQCPPKVCVSSPLNSSYLASLVAI